MLNFIADKKIQKAVQHLILCTVWEQYVIMVEHCIEMDT